MPQPPTPTTPANPPAPVVVVDASGNFTPFPMSYGTSGGNATIAASIPAVAGQTSFITGFEITAGGALSGTVVGATLTGVATLSGTATVGGTLTYFVAAVGGTVGSIVPLAIEFSPPLPAFAPNTAITLTLPALGAGENFAAINVHGYSR